MYSHKRLMRDLLTATATTGGAKLAGPNPRRYGMILCSPQPLQNVETSGGNQTHNVSVATLGIKLSYTVPAGASAVMLSASAFLTAGAAPTIALELVRGATTYTLTNTTTNIYTGVEVPLQAGDTIQWDVTVVGAAGTMDLTLNVTQDKSLTYVTVSFGPQPTLDKGINLYPGTAPTVLLAEHFGEAIHEEVWVISSTGSLTLAATDVFG